MHQSVRPRFVPRTPGGKIGSGMEPSRSAFGQFLRRWRLHRGISQRSLARMLGCSQTRLSSLERGETRGMRESDIEKFARVLAVSPKRLKRLLPPPPPLLPPKTPLARLLRARREELGLSRMELAKRVGGIDDVYLGVLERTACEVRYSLMVRLARALQIEQATLARFVAVSAAPPGGSLGAAIRRRRKALGLSAQALGERLGISKTAVRAIEQGQVTLAHRRSDATIARIARALEMDEAALAALRAPVTRAHLAPARTIGGQVARARIARRWSQEELARRCGLAAGSICYIETNQVRPRLSSLRALAQVLDLDVNRLARSLPRRRV